MAWTRFRFRLVWLFVATTIIAICLAVWRYDSELFVNIAVAAFVVNVLGYVAGLFVTHGLRFPNDGSYDELTIEPDDHQDSDE